MKPNFFTLLFLSFLPFLQISCQNTNTQEIELSDWDNVKDCQFGDGRIYAFCGCGFMLVTPCEISKATLPYSDGFEQLGRYYSGTFAEEDSIYETTYSLFIQRRIDALHGKIPSNNPKDQKMELLEEIKYYPNKSIVPMDYYDGQKEGLYEGMKFDGEEDGKVTAGYIFIKEDLIITMLVGSKKDAIIKRDDLLKHLVIISRETAIPDAQPNHYTRQSFPFGYNFIVPAEMVVENSSDSTYCYSIDIPEEENRLFNGGYYTISAQILPKDAIDMSDEGISKIPSLLFPTFDSLQFQPYFAKVPYDLVITYEGYNHGDRHQGATIVNGNFVIFIDVLTDQVVDNSIEQIIHSIQKL